MSGSKQADCTIASTKAKQIRVFFRDRAEYCEEVIIVTRSLRDLALTAHITCSVGLLGAIGAFLALAIAGLTVHEPQFTRAAYLAMALIAQGVIVPLALASLVTGLIQSLGTSWGLFRHYWVVAKLLLTAFATAVLLAKMELVTYAADLAGEAILPVSDLRTVGFELVTHSAGGLLVLLVPVVLSVYKPRGLTPYGRRKEHAQRGWPNQRPRPSVASGVGIGVSPRKGTVSVSLRYSHLLGIVVTVLIAHFVILHLFGVGLGAH